MAMGMQVGGHVDLRLDVQVLEAEVWGQGVQCWLRLVKVILCRSMRVCVPIADTHWLVWEYLKPSVWPEVSSGGNNLMRQGVSCAAGKVIQWQEGARVRGMQHMMTSCCSAGWGAAQAGRGD